ncbi:MAG: tetratricopeptide repeat protein [Bacteroidota bacterium]
MKAEKALLYIIFLIFLVTSLFGQSEKLDSLWNEYKMAKHDTTRIKLLNEKIGDIYESLNPDSAILVYNQAIDLADKNIKKQSANAKQFLLLKAFSLKSIGDFHKNHGSYNDAIEYFLNVLKIYQDISDKVGISDCYYSIGIVYSQQGSYDKAIEYSLMSLKIAEELADNRGISKCYNNIGIIYKYQGSYDMAIEYYLKALKSLEEIGDKKGMSNSYTNIGNAYASQALYDKNYRENRDSLLNCAIDHYLSALEVYEELNNKNGMSRCYGNIGIIRKNQGQYDDAIEYFLKALKIFEELDDKNGISQALINIGTLQLFLGDSVAKTQIEKTKQYNEAINSGLKAFNLAREINAAPREFEAAGLLLQSYDARDKFAEALKYAKIFIAIKDSMFSEEKTKSLAEMEAKYENEKKQFEIEKMQKQKELDNKTIEAQQAKNRKQQIIIISVIGGFIIILMFLIIIFRMFRQKRKANILLSTQNAEINQQKEEISAQRDEIETQRDEIITQRDTVMLQKNHIEGQKKEITDSIKYAKRIQQAVLPAGENASGILGDHFVLFRPKDIVSGDFYWGTRINEWLIFAVADCTGHGVPGAFMSMLGVSFLKEIVRNKEMVKASDVLEHLRESIIEALQQKGQSGEQKDGLDIALCALNIHSENDSFTLQYAGANNPLFIVTTQKKLIEIEPDKQPVAIYENMTSFTNHIIQLQKGDTIYLTSDGYADQFGGQNNKKFKKKQLKELFVDIAGKPMDEQKQILETTIENWQSTGDVKNDQIDDVTILGMKI